MNIDGARTPIYPLFLGLAQWLAGTSPAATLTLRAAEIACSLQAIFGILASILFFIILGKLGCKRSVVLITSIFFAASPTILMAERAILPQALECSFLVIATSLLFSIYGSKAILPERYPIGLTLLVGLVFSVTVLTRPDSLVYLSLLTIFAFFSTRRPRSLNPAIHNNLRLLLVLSWVIAAIPLTGWAEFNKLNNGYFTITTLIGWNKTAAVRNMFDLVDEKDRVLGEIMSRKYKETMQTNPKRYDYVCDAWGEIISRASELPIPRREPWHLGVDVSNYLDQVSRSLIKHHPKMWLINSASNFMDTFDFSANPVISINDNQTIEGNSAVRNPIPYNAIQIVDKLGAKLNILAYVFFILSFIYSGAALIVNNIFTHLSVNTQFEEDLLVFGTSAATLGTFIAFTLFSCYLPRYGAPYLAMILIGAAYGSSNLISAVFRKTRGSRVI